MNTLTTLIVLICGLSLYEFFTNQEVTLPAGVLIVQAPSQVNLPEPHQKMLYKKATLEFLANYTIQARVLSKETYYLDRFADIAPIDLALGWQQMSNTDLLKQLHISQADRFYFFRWKEPAPLNPQLMAQESANVHIIPANDFIKNKIKKLRQGQLIQISGQLVKATQPDGAQITSSLSRDDTGAGACEVIYVTDIQTLNTTSN